MVAQSITPSTTAQLLAGLNQVESIRKKIRLNYTVIGTVLLIGKWFSYDKSGNKTKTKF